MGLPDAYRHFGSFFEASNEERQAMLELVDADKQAAQMESDLTVTTSASKDAASEHGESNWLQSFEPLSEPT